MKNAVLYSIKGSEEKPSSGSDKIKAIARSIAAGANATAYPIGKHTFVSEKSILFIGCEVGSSGKLHRSLRKVLKELSQSEVALVVLFTIAKNDVLTSLPEVKLLLDPFNVPVCDEEFICLKNSGGKRKGPPSEEDLNKAKQFAADICSKYKNAN